MGNENRQGPRVRANVPAAIRAEVDRVLAGADAEDFIEAVTRSIGCACGAAHVEARDKVFVDSGGVVHRHGVPCYTVEPKPERAGRAGDQPLPEQGKQNVVDDLITHLRARIELGVKRYGRPLETFNGRDAHQDELEEFVDGWIYRWQSRMERAALQEELEKLRAQVKVMCCGKGGCSK
jgi:hypothetical protein